LLPRGTASYFESWNVAPGGVLASPAIDRPARPE